MDQKRYEALIHIGCICCRLQESTCCGPVEVHHLNLGGKAGQRRLGDDYTIPLGAWHHRGTPYWMETKSRMRTLFGPSLALQSKLFRERYGTDETLLAKTNELIRCALTASA